MTPELDDTLPALAARHAHRNPDAVAVLDRQGEATYGELLQRAETLAGALRARGVGTATLVGLATERTRMRVVGMLGIHLAGGAYVPLDPGLPAERLRFMAEDAGLRLVVCDEGATGALRRLNVEPVPVDCATGPAVPRPAFPAPRDLAYVIFTSGTTGRPKGVMVEHRGLANLVPSSRALFDLRPGTRVLHHLNFGFDYATYELAIALGTGGTACLPPPEIEADALPAWIDDAGVEVANFVPSLLAALPDADLPRLRVLIAGGEPCPQELVDRWGPGRRFFNAYGPTEASIVTTIGECRPGSRRERPPIGTPLAGVSCHVLDDAQRPVPDGTEGELYIGGTGVARGYLHRPELTEQRFLSDPFAAEPGARMYRTGDLVRVLDDGQLDFLGRTDHQVKVRGYRIELEEIEAVLSRSPDVAQAVVQVVGDDRSAGRLVAYVRGHDGRAPDVARVRELGARMLPDYMVPAHVVALERFPLTTSGKVDRRALPAPAVEGGSEPPVGPVEHAVAAIWADLCGIPRVGRRDDFFALGGDSLLAARMVGQVRAALGRDATIAMLLEDATLAGFAERVDRGASAPVPAPPPAGAAQASELVSSPGQEQLWAHAFRVHPEPVYNECFQLRLCFEVDARALRRAFEALARTHEAMRMAFLWPDGRPHLAIAERARVALRRLDLRELDEPAREAALHRLAEAESQRAFDLSRPPLWRAALVTLADRDHRLLVTWHHLVVDGWSLRHVFFPQLAEAYRAAIDGVAWAPPRPPPSQLTFAAAAHRGVRPAAAERLERLLAGATPVNMAPHRGGGGNLTSGAHHTVRLDAGVVRAVDAVAHREGVTQFAVYLAGLNALVAEQAGTRDVVVATPVATVRQGGFEELLGYCQTTVPVRTNVPEDTTGAGALASAHRAVLESVALAAELPATALAGDRLAALMRLGLTLEPDRVSLPAGWILRPHDLDTGATPVELGLGLEAVGDEVSARFEYARTLYDEPTVRRLGRRYAELVAEIAR